MQPVFGTLVSHGRQTDCRINLFIPPEIIRKSIRLILEVTFGEDSFAAIQLFNYYLAPYCIGSSARSNKHRRIL